MAAAASASALPAGPEVGSGVLVRKNQVAGQRVGVLRIVSIRIIAWLLRLLDPLRIKPDDERQSLDRFLEFHAATRYLMRRYETFLVDQGLRRAWTCGGLRNYRRRGFPACGSGIRLACDRQGWACSVGRGSSCFDLGRCVRIAGGMNSASTSPAFPRRFSKLYRPAA